MCLLVSPSLSLAVRGTHLPPLQRLSLSLYIHPHYSCLLSVVNYFASLKQSVTLYQQARGTHWTRVSQYLSLHLCIPSPVLVVGCCLSPHFPQLVTFTSLSSYYLLLYVAVYFLGITICRVLFMLLLPSNIHFHFPNKYKSSSTWHLVVDSFSLSTNFFSLLLFG